MHIITDNVANQKAIESTIKKALEEIIIDREGMSLREAYKKGFEDAIKLIREVYELKQ